MAVRGTLATLPLPGESSSTLRPAAAANAARRRWSGLFTVSTSGLGVSGTV